MFRKFSNTSKIAQNIPSDFTVKFSLLNANKGNLCFLSRPLFEDVRVRENFVERSVGICSWFQLQLWDLLFNGENGNNLSYTGI